MKSAWSRGAVVLLLLVPGGLSDPVKGETCISPDLDGSRFCLPDRLLHGLHQVLSIVDQHLSSLLGKKYKKYGDDGDWKDTFYWTFNGKWLIILWSVRLGSPALIPLHWCWCDPTWWPWPWTGSWAACWWWVYAHTPESEVIWHQTSEAWAI